MALGRNFEEAILKAVRSLETGQIHIELKHAEDNADNWIEKRIRKAGDERLFFIAEALRRGVTVEKIHEWSQIDLWFLNKLQNIIDMEKTLSENKNDLEVLRQAKRLGFADKKISELWETTPEAIYALRKETGIIPVYKMVDTCAAEFESTTPY
ncbi:carbamoyl-phosphate synthase large subunit, partial [Butyricicoccus sp. 1XD8-22]